MASSTISAATNYEPGGVLRVHRERAGVSMAAAAERLRRDVSWLSRVERDQYKPSPAEVELLCLLYGKTSKKFIDAVIGMYDAAARKPWWYEYKQALPSRGRFGWYMEREREALRIRTVEIGVVPGLVQTEQYAEAIIRSSLQPLTDDEVQRRVALRMARQVGLSELHIVIDEGGLARMVGGKPVMLGQVEKLLELGARPDVEIQILPAEVGAHPAIDGPFVLLNLPPLPSVLEIESEHVVAYTDHVLGSQVFERAEDVEVFTAIWDGVCRAALPPTETADHLRRMASDLRDP